MFWSKAFFLQTNGGSLELYHKAMTVTFAVFGVLPLQRSRWLLGFHSPHFIFCSIFSCGKVIFFVLKAVCIYLRVYSYNTKEEAVMNFGWTRGTLKNFS